MTNKEHALKILDKNDDLLIQLIRSCDCTVCGSLGCRDYCKSSETKNLSCEETITTWLTKEHSDNLFPLGTVVEIDVHSLSGSQKRVGYYNGHVHDDIHSVCTYVSSVGDKGCGFLINTKDIKKVGD